MTRPTTMQPAERGEEEAGNRGWPDDVRAAERAGAEFGHVAMPLGGIGTCVQGCS